MKRLTLLVGIPFAIAFSNKAPAICQNWGEAYKIGALETSMINEASGLEWSTARPDFLYLNNDSGDGPNIYTTGLDGKNTKKQKINGIGARDAEDISLGPCPTGKEQCLFFGDIGDGGIGSKTPKITIVKESDLIKGSSVTALKTVSLNLETGDVDMEGMGVHPSGDLFLATKEYDQQYTRIMRVPRTSLNSSNAHAKIVATIDLSKFGFKGEEYLVTGMDIADDGLSFILLTYGAVLEVNYDLTKVGDKPVELAHETKLIHVPMLPQQEAIAYKGEKSFLYTTEEGDGTPIMQVDCKE